METIGQFICEVKEVHISQIMTGDTILHTDGEIRTVGKENIKRDSFMGKTLFGDSYKCGYQMVKKVTHLVDNNL